MTVSEIKAITARLDMRIFGKKFFVRVEPDNKFGGRIFIQITYYDHCRISGLYKSWHGRKWYLSDHMTTDEIIKTCYAAYKATVEHEVMESFTVDGKVLFNPHVSFEALLAVTDQEVKREVQRI